MADDTLQLDSLRLRDLGPAEKYSLIRSELGIYINVGLTAHYKQHHDAPLKANLFYALSILIKKHPILSAIPMTVGSKTPAFYRVPCIKLDDAVTFVEVDLHSSDSTWGAHLDNILEDQHNIPFSIPNNSHLQPFWRFLVIERSRDSTKFTLVFIFHHALMDTKSALSLHEELEHLMATNLQYRVAETILTPPELRLLPPLEDLRIFSASSEFLIKQEQPHLPDPRSWTATVQKTPVKTRFSSLYLTSSETKTLALLSRIQQSSITAAIQTILAGNIFSILPLNFQTIQVDCAVSLRKLLPAPINTTSLGCYVGSLSVTYPRVPCFSWQEARRTKCAIEHDLEKKGNDMPVVYLGHIPDMRLWMSQKLGTERGSALELSNVGRSSTIKKTESKFEMKSLLFSQSSSACSAALKVSAVTGPDGRLLWVSPGRRESLRLIWSRVYKAHSKKI